jgi:hypothetical protein
LSSSRLPSPLTRRESAMQLRAARKPSSRRNVRLAGPGQGSLRAHSRHADRDPGCRVRRARPDYPGQLTGGPPPRARFQSFPRALMSVPIGAVLGFALYALKRPPNPTRDHPWLGNRQAPRGNDTHSAAGLRGPKLHGLHGLRKGAAKGARVAARTDGSQGFDLDLPCPLLRDPQDLRDFAERAGLFAVEPMAHLEHFSLALG